MYILVPLALLVIAFVGIALIVSRKFSYLKKLTPESHEFGPTIFHDFFPELFGAIGRIHLEQYVALFSKELEKLLRWVRLLFSRIDSASSALITELRHVSARRRVPVQQESNTAGVRQEVPVSAPDLHIEVRPRKGLSESMELKAREQQLIIDIAQHPKDAMLYASLGEVYLQMQSFEDAKEAFEAAIDLDKTNESLKQRLSYALRRLHENKIGF